MSWPNGRTRQQVTYLERPLDRGTAVGIEQQLLNLEAAVMQVFTAVGWKRGRWKVCTTVEQMQGRVKVYASRYADARVVVNIPADL